MTFLTVLKILSYILCAGVPSFLLLRNNKKKLHERDATITNLRNEIVNIIEVQGDLKDVEEQNKAIKKIITDSPDIDSAYADRLPDMPRKKSRSNKDA